MTRDSILSILLVVLCTGGVALLLAGAARTGGRR